jgi:hypothetical protein
MRRIDLVAATMQGWSRLDPAQRDQFFEAFVSAALRLDRVAMRDWLRKRLRNRPLAAPVDLTHLSISDADMALLMRVAREAPDEVAAAADRDEANGGVIPNGY